MRKILCEPAFLCLVAQRCKQYDNASYAQGNGVDGINAFGEASNNASFNNGGVGLEMDQRFMGYFANVAHNNKFGAVFEGTSMGNNLCDGSAC